MIDVTRTLSQQVSLLVSLTMLVLVGCKERQHTAFTAMPFTHTGIDFSNQLTQTEYFNIIEYLYFYNGGGVALGDINNDGLDDIFFTASQDQNKLYLNKGGLVFEDITESAGITDVGNWKTGVAMADVNGDGFLDIYVCGVGNYKYFNGKNQLLINNGDLTFSDMTSAYGLDFQGFSTHAAFFDYDLDGDLDMYLLNHSVHSVRSYGRSELRQQKDSLAGDRLYRNELVPHGVERFTDVTLEAGIYTSQIGYGLGVGVSDINDDGYPDVYVSNDFHENDYLYMNNGDGTFAERSGTATPHASRFSMGNDIADINNDGLTDIITLDMLPKDERILKTTAGEDPYDIYSYKLTFGYNRQYARNALQLNRGRAPSGEVIFSDIAPMAGIEASDWSWAPLLADFDNDGKKDLFVTNGIVTRPNDLDYINFISTDSAQQAYDYKTFVSKMPSGKVANFFYRNTGRLRFDDVSGKWTGLTPTFSTGAAYSDLDRDGDLDLVVNNIGERAAIYRNDMAGDSSSWIQFRLKGDGANTFGVGTKVTVYAGREKYFYEQFPSRGFQSSVTFLLHAGLGKASVVDSVEVEWPDGKSQVLYSLAVNAEAEVLQSQASERSHTHRKDVPRPVLTRVDSGNLFAHRENKEFSPFTFEKLIPHALSTQGPAIAKADVNGDGLEDFFVGGAAGQSGAVYLQTESGMFLRGKQPALAADSAFEDAGAAFLDADGNGTMDLVVASAGQQFYGDEPLLRPRLYINDGAGTFSVASGGLPRVYLNASCVSVADVDGDGDSDIFIGGRVIASRYGDLPKSYLFKNDGRGTFTDESERLGSAGGYLGMVTDAEWIDMNSDNRPDLALSGEWMPVTILLQDASGNFLDRTEEFGLGRSHGWWNALHFTDIDEDGDLDFLAGNLGLNSRLRATQDKPITLYAGDMDDDGGMDHLLTYYNGGESHPFISRDQLVKQVPSFRRAFLKYNTFGDVKRENIIPASNAGRFKIHTAYQFASALFVYHAGVFRMVPLPQEAQMFPVFGFETGDVNKDGFKDILAVGNFYAVQPDFGRYDAGYGLILAGTGNGGFVPLSPGESGFFVPGEGRQVEAITTAKGEAVYLVGRNDDSLLLFR